MAALRSSIRHYRFFSSSTTTTTKSTSPLTIFGVKAKFRSEHDPDKALEIYNSLSDTYAYPMANRCAQDLTVKRLAKSRRFADIAKLIDSHKKNPKITQENYFSTLIRSYGLAGMYDHAFRLFNQMDELGTPRSSISFNALLTAYNVSKKFDEVPKLFNEISEKFGISPDKISYGILIKSYCELSLPESAFSILKEMDEKKIEITAITYTTILDSFYKKRKVEGAEQIWKQMIEKGCTPDVTAYNVRIMHASWGKPEDVLSLIDEMTKAGLKPDIITYNYLCTCYFKNGMMEDANKVYQDLQENGCFPNPETFRLNIFYLCKSGDFEKAYEVFMESVKKDKVPAFGTMKILVEGLVKNSKTKEATSVFKIVRKKFPNNLLNAWKKLEDDLGLSKDEETLTKKADASAASA
ncbi:Pentatricopeptide repeat-containing protein [Thalictrum thalictroides]|uniref:Pentatricopeptide repeat-containing protein n=1 Tax=Thalictrum thalictroides TaxID=46969 RepID=A0A7J6WFP4_THATH|nr:Pentatricopeptide repeat-containing protein [Thalictrum thalictroides]